jgi:outer membrane receptor protein involved in Fe transport
VQILIDGKPSNLVGLSGSGGLQQLQGNLIERVEIITNPSARYDAAGGAGIINIILKKEKSKGFNGSFQLQTGAPANHGASVNVNYRTGWMNWFVNYGVNYRENPGEGYTNLSYYRTDSSYFINQSNERLRRGLSQNIRFGSDIFFNEKNILTLSASLRDSDDENTTEVGYDYLNSQETQFGNRIRIDNEDETDLNWQYALNYSRDFNRRGQKFTFDVQYQVNSEVELSAFDDDTFIDNQLPESLIQRSSNDNGEKQTLIQADYIHPFGKAARIETGVRYTNRAIFNDYKVESDSTETGNFEEVIQFTNDFNFDERIFASYFLLSNQLDNFSYQVGTRLEHTFLETYQEQQDTLNNQNYMSLFPSANVSYKLTDEKSVQLSYSRRISRPNFRSLNPFNSFSDPLNIYAGNPNLQPQFTDSYEVGLLNNQPNSSVYYGVYYRHTDGVVQRIQREEEGITYRSPENLSIENAIGIEVNVTRDFGKKFRTSGNFNFYNSRISGNGFYAEATTFNARWGNIYNNPKLFDAQLNVWYRAPQNNAQGRQFGMASVDLGISKDVMQKNGTVAMNVQDLFNTRKYRGETITDTFSSVSEFQWRRGPTMTLSFTYRLNQAKERQRRRGNGDGDRGGMGEGFEEGDFGSR